MELHHWSLDVVTIVFQVSVLQYLPCVKEKKKKKKKDKLEAHKAHHGVPHSYKIEENLNMQTFAHTFSYVYIFFSYVYFYIHTKIPEGTLKSGGFVRVTGFLRSLIFH